MAKRLCLDPTDPLHRLQGMVDIRIGVKRPQAETHAAMGITSHCLMHQGRARQAGSDGNVKIRVFSETVNW